MTLPKPIKDVIDFVLALPSALDKGYGPSVRALGESGPMAIRPECVSGSAEVFWSNHFTECNCTLCRDAEGKQHPVLVGHLKTANFKSGDTVHRAETSVRHETQKPPPTERSRICNMRWANTTVLLGDTDFVRCRFFNCKLIDDGPFSMERCLMENCTIQSRDSYEKTSTAVRSVR